MRETVAARAGPQGPSSSIAQELPSLAAYYTLNNYFDADAEICGSGGKS